MKQNTNYNIGSVSEYAIKNFWSKIDQNASVKEVKDLYEKFFNEHYTEITESVKLITEKYKNAKSESVNEDFLSDIRAAAAAKSKKATAKKFDDDDIPDDVNSTDDLEKDAVKKANAKQGQTVGTKTIQVNYGSINPTMHNRGKRAYIDQDELDINFMSDLTYMQIQNGDYKKDDGTPYTINDKILPYSTWNVYDVTDFTAVFAFKDLPNVDLSQWDVKNGTSFEGMFYKSTFNNDSIMDWKLESARNVKNMFIGSDFNKKSVIDHWKKTINKDLAEKGIFPVIGKASANDAAEVGQRTIKRFGKFEDNYEKIKQYNMNAMMEEPEEKNENKKYVMDSSDFIAEMYGLNEGIIGDFAKKSFKKIKGALDTVGIKLKNGFVFIINKMMDTLGANFPENIVNFIKKSNMRGVYAEIGKGVNYPEKKGWYENIEKGSREYENYVKFMGYCSNGVNESLEVNERKVGVGSTDIIDDHEYTNIGIGKDIDTKQLKLWLNSALKAIKTGGASTMQPAIIWGAPGIGKTTIPREIIKEINKEIVKNGGGEDEKMSVIVIDCSLLQAGDLNMPMPVKVDETTFDEIRRLPVIKTMNQERRDAGLNPLTDDELREYVTPKSSDAPKTWLPAFKPTPDNKVNNVRNDIANGWSNAIFDDNGNLIASEWRGGGGIIIFDEFLRTDPSNLFVIANIMMERTISDYKLGTKWYVMGCSNRPADDTDVKTNFQGAPDAMFSRPTHFNFIPDFKDWCKWAKEEGGFDDFTISFISATDPYGKNSRWHNIDPEYNRSNYVVNTVTPRSWSQMINQLNKLCKQENVKSYLDLGDLFEMTVGGKLPKKIAESYVEEYKLCNGVPFNFTIEEIIENPELNIKNQNINAISITNFILTEVRATWSINDPIPPKCLNAIIHFLENNIGKDTGNTMVTCIAKIAAYCGLLTKNYKKKNPHTGKYDGDFVRPESEEWFNILTDFTITHPSFADVIETTKIGRMA